MQNNLVVDDERDLRIFVSTGVKSLGFVLKIFYKLNSF
jgi:hypothetical protein